VVHRTVRCTPDSVQCQTGALGERVALGKSKGATAIIQQNVQCAPDYPVCQPRAQLMVDRTISGRHVAQPTVSRRHRTVRCATRAMAGNGRLRQRRNEIEHCSISDGAPDCLVHPRTEGNKGLPNGAPTTPRSLGAVKGIPRRMELQTKLSLNILQRRDIEFMPLL
jgi:hypothetical protein